jgi:Zn-dependent protease
MLIDEPPRSRGDIHFVLFGFPVRIHPLFWLMALVLGHNSPGVKPLVAWVAAVLISILVHEWGHALVMRGYGMRPWITLHGLGGVTSAGGGPGFAPALRAQDQVLISAAGPAADFLLAAAVCGAIVLSGHRLDYQWGLPSGLMVWPAGIVGSPLWTDFLADILFTSVVWAVLNLMPIYPLDGGQIAREVLLAARGREGMRQSLLLSVWTAAALAVLGLARGHDFFMALFFGVLAFQSYLLLRADRGAAGPW